MDNIMEEAIKNFRYYEQVQIELQKSANISYITGEPDLLKDVVWVTPELFNCISNPTIIYSDGDYYK